MRVSVRYMAQARRAAGEAVESVELDRPCTARELVVRLAQSGGEPLRRLLLDAHGEVHPALLLFVGVEQVSSEHAGPLRDGDVVTVLSPMAGG